MTVMKKYLTLFAMAAMAVAVVSCQKESFDSSTQEDQIGKTTIKAGIPELTKVALSEGESCLKTAWEEGDQLILVDANQNSSSFTLETGAGTQSATFSGTLPEGATAPYDITIAVKESRRIAVQSGNSDPSNVLYTATLKGVADYSEIDFSAEWAESTGASFESSSVLKFIVKLPADAKNVSEIRFNDNDLITANVVSELSTAVTKLDASASDQIITVYLGVEKSMTVKANEAYTVTVVADGNSYVKHIVIPQEKVLSGKCYTVQLNAANWNKMAGTGTESDPFVLKTAADMQEISGLLANAGEVRYFSMANDIDLDGIAWTPIVTAAANKPMYFEGNNHVISNLAVTAVNGYAGFFGEFSGTMKNVKFSNPVITAPDVASYVGTAVSRAGRFATAVLDNVDVSGAAFTVGPFASPTGLLIGDVFGSVNVTKCDVAGSITYGGINNQNRVGGLIGDIIGKGNDEITDCTTDVTINVTTKNARVAAGFIGRLYNAAGKTVIKNSKAAGTITMNAGLFGAGFIGAGFKTFEITDCSTSVSLSGVSNYNGGFIGANNANAADSFIKKCSATGAVTLVAAQYGGAFFGDIQYPIVLENCYATGKVSGTTNALCRVGGFCGDVTNAASGSTLTDCHYIGEVDLTTGVAATAWLGVGGFIGTCDATIEFTRCYTGGSLAVSEGKVAAGFIGLQSKPATIKNCYSTMAVNHQGVSQYVGGLLGRVTGAGTIVENSYYSGTITTGVKGTNAGCSLVGGILGGAEAILSIKNCYSTGSIVNANDGVGGIVGQLAKYVISVENCYSTMEIGGVSGLGGIIGKASNAAAISNPALASTYTVSKCIAWNTSIKSHSATKINPATSFGAGAVIGYVLPLSNLSGCVRKSAMTFDCYSVSECNVLFDQSDATTTSPLLFGTINPKPAHFFPYHGIEASEFDTMSFIAQGLGWSDEIWDFLGEEPVLKGMTL